MAGIHFIEALQGLFGAQEASIVLAALRSNRLAWKALDDENFAGRALSALGDQLNLWNPGNLALLMLDEELLVGRLNTEPLPGLEGSLRQRAIKFYEDFRRKEQVPSSLLEEGLLALALRERRRLTGSWTGLADELKPRSSSTSPSLWNGPLACLAGMVFNKSELLENILSAGNVLGPIGWAAQIILGMPATLSALSTLLIDGLRAMPVQTQLDFLNRVRQRGREELAAKVAGVLLTAHPGLQSLKTRLDLETVGVDGLAARSVALHQLGTFYQLAGSTTQSRTCFKAASHVLAYWQANLQMGAVVSGEEIAGVAKQVVNLPSLSPKLMGSLGRLVLEKPSPDVDLEEIVDPTRDPYLLIGKALQIMGRGEGETAKDLANQAVDAFIERIREGGFLEDVTEFIRSLISLGLSHEALLCCETALEQRPSDAELIRLTSALMAERGTIDRARGLAELAAALQPDSTELRRHLANICEMNGHWQQAFEQRQIVITQASAPELDDKTAFIRAALLSGRVEEAMQASFDLLEAHPDAGEAHGWLGKALAVQGRLDDAINHLNRATLIDPEQAEWWLELAAIYHNNGRREQEIETLRAAVMAAPSSCEVHFGLGKAFQRDGFTSEALLYLKQAAKLKPGDPEIVLTYSQVLRELGHISEARAALEACRSKWIHYPELAYEYANVTQCQEDWGAVLPALELAARSEKALPEWRLRYAEVLLEDHPNGQSGRKTLRAAQAIEIISLVMENIPDDSRSQFLMAEALRKKDDFDRALDLYRQLADKLRREPSDLAWQVNRGLGLTALALGQSELAVVSLKEAQQAQPMNLALLHELAKAYWAAQLKRDAIQTAESALQLAPHDPENLLWFAETVTMFGEQKRAKDALKHAIELQPENVISHLRLGKIEIESGAVEDAHATIDRLVDLPIQAAELQQAAYLYLRLRDSQAAMRCLERVTTLDDHPSPDMLFDLAKLYEEAGKLGDAMEAVQRVVYEGCDNTRAYLLQADLLARMGRYEAAQAILDRLETETGENECFSKIDILERSATWYLQSGNLPHALQQAQQGITISPNHLLLRKLAVKAALGMLLNEKALQIIHDVPVQDLLDEESGIGYDLLCDRIDLALDGADYEEASNLIKSGLLRWEDQPRLQYFIAQIKTVQGDLTGLEISPDTEQEVDTTIGLAKSALAMGLWRSGLELLEKLLVKISENPRAAFEFARALVLCAEAFRTFQEIHIQSHLPPADSLSEERQTQFEQLMEKAARFGSTPLLQRWYARGKVAFNPTPQTLKDLAGMAVLPDEFAALAAGLRAIQNPQAALHAVSRFNAAPECLLQQVLVGLSGHAKENLPAVECLAQNWPNHPVYQAAAAEFYMKKGDKGYARKLFESALTIWSDEAAWHAQAAQLAADEADATGELAHWKAAQSNDPARPVYSRSLGKALLQHGDVARAIEALERATRLEPSNVQGWLGLAHGLFEANRLPGAMECSLRASELEGDGVDAILLSGKIALAMGEVDIAQEYAWVAARRNPYHPDTVLALSSILTQQGQYEEALAVIEQALPNLEPTVQVLFERARLLFRLKGAEAALGALQNLAREYEDHSDVLALLAKAQAECGDYKNAERSAFRALRLNPNQAELSMLLGRLQRESGQLDQAVHLLSEAIRLDPSNVEYYLELGQAYLARREDVQALNVYRQATRMAPKDPRAYCQAATLLRDSKDYPGAEAMLQQAAKLAPDDLQVRRQLVGVMTLNLIHKTQEAGSTL